MNHDFVIQQARLFTALQLDQEAMNNARIKIFLQIGWFFFTAIFRNNYTKGDTTPSRVDKSGRLTGKNKIF